MDGVINVLKPTGMTSHDVVYHIRKKFNIQKVGHTGTLDPNVAGVLPITIGKGTKLTQILTNKEKTYRCLMTFGKRTDTSDSYGDVVEEKINKKIEKEQIYNNIKSFIGEIQQTPSAFSAIKVDGQKLYKKARKGMDIDFIPSRKVFIKSIDIISSDDKTIFFDVSCSKGTYVRTLVEDIGKSLNTISYMNYLIRIRSGQFDIDNSVRLDEIDEKSIIPIDDIEISGNKKIILNDYQIYRYKNGLKMGIDYIENFEYSDINIYKIYNIKNELISIGHLVENNLKNILML